MYKGLSSLHKSPDLLEAAVLVKCLVNKNTSTLRESFCHNVVEINGGQLQEVVRILPVDSRIQVLKQFCAKYRYTPKLAAISEEMDYQL
jgi:hypothetical protein